jgi:hypothetical protein
MSTHSTDTRELREDENEGETDAPSRAKRVISMVDGNGRLSLLLGAALLVRGGRTLSRSKGRALLQGALGAALLAVGLRRRRSGTETEGANELKEEGASDEAHAARVQGGYKDPENPRGTSGEPDVERETHEGNVEFTEEQGIEPSHQPDLEDEAGVEDPRRDHGDETEIDLSEAAMADEPSEAAGPSSAQAQPAETEGTEPEPTAEEDASHVEADTPGGDDGGDPGGDEPDPDADPGEATREAAEAEPANVADEIIEGETDEEDREGVVTEGGAKVHTDTNESDTMDIDEDDVTDPDDELNEEPPDSENQSSSHLVDEDDEQREE